MHSLQNARLQSDADSFVGCWSGIGSQMTMRCGKYVAIICHSRSRDDTAPWQSQRGVKKKKKSALRKEGMHYPEGGRFWKEQEIIFCGFLINPARAPSGVYCTYVCLLSRSAFFPQLFSSSTPPHPHLPPPPSPLPPLPPFQHWGQFQVSAVIKSRTAGGRVN